MFQLENFFYSTYYIFGCSLITPFIFGNDWSCCLFGVPSRHWEPARPLLSVFWLMDSIGCGLDRDGIDGNLADYPDHPDNPDHLSTMLTQDRLWRWFCDADPNLWMLIPDAALWRWFDSIVSDPEFNRFQSIQTYESLWISIPFSGMENTKDSIVGPCLWFCVIAGDITKFFGAEKYYAKSLISSDRRASYFCWWKFQGMGMDQNRAPWFS